MFGSIAHRFQVFDQLRLNLGSCHDVDVKRRATMALRSQPEGADHRKLLISLIKEITHEHENTGEVHCYAMLHGFGFVGP